MGQISIAGAVTTAIIHSIDATPLDLRAKRTHRWGVRGESEIVSAPAGRDISVDVTLYGFATYNDLDAQLKLFDDLQGIHGTVRIDTDAYVREFQNTTYLAFAQNRHAGSGPLPDIGGGLGGGVNYWWVQGTFHFRQLRD